MNTLKNYNLKNYIEFSGFKQRGYYIQTNDAVIEHLNQADWHLIEGNYNTYIIFLSSDMAKFSDNVEGLKELILINGKYFVKKDKSIIDLKKIPEDIEEYYDEYDFLYTGGQEFDDIMIERGYFDYGGTRRSHRYITDKFKNMLLVDLLNDLTGKDIKGANIITLYDYLYEVKATESYDSSTESHTKTEPNVSEKLLEFYSIVTKLGLRNTCTLSTPPKEAPSRMIENGVPGMIPTTFIDRYFTDTERELLMNDMVTITADNPRNLVMEDFMMKCRNLMLERGFSVNYLPSGNIVFTKGDESHIATSEKGVIDTLKNIIK